MVGILVGGGGVGGARRWVLGDGLCGAPVLS